MDPRSALAELAEDRTRGATEIARRARQQLARLADEEQLDAGEISPAARQAVLALLEAHPSMAPLVHLADETIGRLEASGPNGLGQLPRQPPASRQVAEHAREAIAQTDTVLTYSRSGTVIAALEEALARAPLRVLTSEARPGQEGLGVAESLQDAGAQVELTYDVHLPALVAEADLVVVGADAITARAFVNKTGTRTLLERAQATGTPAHVLASTDKLWPSALPREPATDVEADWQPDLPEDVAVRAPLFERVPLGLVDRIVTDEGARDPADAADEAEGLSVHPDIVEVLEGSSTS